jgi:hypothetical protein
MGGIPVKYINVSAEITFQIPAINLAAVEG